MHRCTWTLAALSSVSSLVVSASPLEPRVPSYVSHPDRLDGVKEAFQRAWDGYYEYAFPNDSLNPISKTYTNDRYETGIVPLSRLRMLIKKIEMDGVRAQLMPFQLL
jgi:mannosyl-oligosaccharide alpha-1,2-mannosidase